MLSMSFQVANAQYFGRNRPIYKRFEFKVYETPNFEIYHYFESDSVVERLAQAAEQWYGMHLEMFRDTIEGKNPIIFYANHADFQQTTAIFGSVEVGTGGVTEALKNRVVLPVTESWAQTDHVLGHELVHAFHYNSILTKDSTNLNSLRNLPLWMIEGMAEYFSIGSVDPHTTMWMRDAVLNNDFPTLEKMTRDPNYFPYRYGHAFCSFVGRTFGDSLIVPIFLETAKRGYDVALQRYLGMDEKTFSDIWKNTTIEHFKMIMKDTIDTPAGTKIVDESNGGHINISPALSPDGKHVAFYSEKDLFSIDLFLAETSTGKITQKLSSTIHRNEIDALNFIESAGAWSPDSKQFAFVAFSRGKTRLLVVDVEKKKMAFEVEIPNVPSFNYPVWSPDGKSIVVSGLVDGQNDLYQYFIESEEVVRLTNDPWTAIHPNWSPDGKKIAFVTDRPSTLDIISKRMPGYYIATFDMDTKRISTHHFFPGASNLNPYYSPDGADIYFLSDRDGFRNLYRYNIESEKIFQETQILTGITGITKLSPAFSVSNETGEIAYSYYYGGKYSIFRASTSDLISKEVNPMMVDLTAGTLPPLNRAVPGIVDRNITKRMGQPETPVDSFQVMKYRPKFKLDYISNIGVGVSTGQMGTGMAGGVEMLFSDIIGANIFHVGLSLNGEIYDFGGQVTYINQKSRVMWGGTVSHIPYSYAFYDRGVGVVTVDNVDYIADTLSLYHYRIFESTIGGLSQFPLSKTRRIEAGGYLTWYNYRVDVHSQLYIDGWYQGYSREKGDAPDGYSLQRLNLAYVVDNSSFGIASPMNGSRQRFQIDKVFGAVDYWGTLADFRQYIFAKPFSFAFKAFYYGRHGSDLGFIYPLYLGYPWLIRGYDNASFSNQLSIDGTGIEPSQLMGDHMAIANFEIRFPFTGPERLTAIKSKFLFTELALFADAGLAWFDKDDIMFKWKTNDITKRIPVVSTGISLRVNLFGMLIIEPFYAIPFQLGGIDAATFGLNFTPGW
jgi:Tol biopolymer transport system component